MKYMLMMNAPGGGPYEIMKWSKQDIEAHMAFMHRLNKKLRGAGELVGGGGLTGPDQAKLVRAGANGEPITDGVFPEAERTASTPERNYLMLHAARLAGTH
jgi:hypothetical protein